MLAERFENPFPQLLHVLDYERVVGLQGVGGSVVMEGGRVVSLQRRSKEYVENIHEELVEFAFVFRESAYLQMPDDAEVDVGMSEMRLQLDGFAVALQWKNEFSLVRIQDKVLEH